MPTWDYVCDECGSVDRNVSGRDCDESAPVCHGKRKTLLWDGLCHEVEFFEPFKTRNIDPEGREIEVKSRRHLSSLVNRHGLTPVDDPNMRMENGKLVKSVNGKRTYFDVGR